MLRTMVSSQQCRIKTDNLCIEVTYMGTKSNLLSKMANLHAFAISSTKFNYKHSYIHLADFS